MTNTNVGAVWDALDREILPLMASYRATISQLEVSTKADDTLLTEADVAIQRKIVALIRSYDPSASILAEEQDDGDLGDRPVTYAGASDVWIVDPIDGTAEFVKPDGIEFCSVVVFAPERTPTACWILAPELGSGRTPLTVRLDGAGYPPEVNGQPAKPAVTGGRTRGASTTRSRKVAPRRFEATASADGLDLKVRTTSQTIDALRTCIDLSPHAELPSFEFFFREDQKVWDGAAGLALATATDRIGVTIDGSELAPIPQRLLTSAEPEFQTSVLAPTSQLPQVLELLRSGPAPR